MGKEIRTVFFDIGDTLGSVQWIGNPAVLRLRVYPYIPGVLHELAGLDLRLGVISNTRRTDTAASMAQMLDEAGIASAFDADLLLYSSVEGLDKRRTEMFRRAAQRAGQTPEECLFVGEDSAERKIASDAGMRVAPHPLLARSIVEGRRLHYAKIRVPADAPDGNWLGALASYLVVPLRRSGPRGSEILAIVSDVSIPKIANALFGLELLGAANAPLLSDLYLLRDDRAVRTGFLHEGGQAMTMFAEPESASWLLGSFPEGLLVALPGGRTIEDYHFAEARHGHNEKLLPDMALLAPVGGWRGKGRPDWQMALVGAEPVGLSESEIGVLRQLTPKLLSIHLSRYTGTAPLDETSPELVRSRHVHHEDNARCVESLARDFQRMGLAVQMHHFTHEGSAMHNVEAELRGKTEELVLVTAHLDSTAASSPPFSSSKDPAPGTDDDGSGVAAVLAAARTLKELAAAKLPQRTLRFVLFNAEEHGLVGSKAYARAQAADEAAIVAVFQMDMIGYNCKDPRSFEVHIGYRPSEEVEDRSRLLAERISSLVPLLAPGLSLPQLYRSANMPAGESDPAEGRSDHSPFQERGYAACVISEDFFLGPEPSSPEPEANPNYHKNTDTLVDLDYAADIARVIAGAAWQTANI